MTFKAYQHAFRKTSGSSKEKWQHPSIISQKRDGFGIRFHCELCDVDLGSTVDPHCGITAHINRVISLDVFQSDSNLKHCAILQCRMEQLHCFVPKMVELQAKLFWVLLSQDSNNIQILEEVHAILSIYEHKERVALLEQAVWRATCIAHESPKDLQEWYKQGWKATKAAFRDANEIGIVRNAVLPFIGDEKTPLPRL